MQLNICSVQGTFTSSHDHDAAIDFLHQLRQAASHNVHNTLRQRVVGVKIDGLPHRFFSPVCIPAVALRQAADIAHCILQNLALHGGSAPALFGDFTGVTGFGGTGLGLRLRSSLWRGLVLPAIVLGLWLIHAGYAAHLDRRG